jgi:desulfoferrodoxin-like iron-binding protein
MAETNQVGKRYVCAHCGSTVICVKPGTGRFHCHGDPMQQLLAKPLPSSD